VCTLCMVGGSVYRDRQSVISDWARCYLVYGYRLCLFTGTGRMAAIFWPFFFCSFTVGEALSRNWRTVVLYVLRLVARLWCPVLPTQAWNCPRAAIGFVSENGGLGSLTCLGGRTCVQAMRLCFSAAGRLRLTSRLRHVYSVTALLRD